MASSTKPNLTAISVLADTHLLSTRRSGQTRDEAITLAQIRTQLDVGLAGGRTINGGTALTDTLKLAGGNAGVGLEVKSRSGVTNWLVATDDGTFGVPMLTVGGATNPWPLYLASRGAHNVTILTNGVARWNIKGVAGAGNIEDASGNSGAATVVWGGGSATVPAYTFVGDLTTGVGRAAAGALALTASGTEVLRLTTAGPRFQTGNTTGSGSALLGANSPASTLTAPSTWLTIIKADGTTGYIPVWS